MKPADLIDALELSKAPSDVVRASVLGALVRYGQAIGNPALVDAAKAAMPAANPFMPPKEWAAKYKDAFYKLRIPNAGWMPTRTAFATAMSTGVTCSMMRSARNDL